MLLDAFDSVIGFIVQVGAKLGLSWISIGALGLTLLTLIISFIATQFSLELKTARAVEKVNLYLESNPFINEENLVEFNKLMKNIPAPMRLQWQQFMVNRNKKPSEFFTENNCIEKPFKASGYKTQIVTVRTCLICVSILSFVFSCGALSNAALSLSQVLIQSALLSSVVMIVGEIYVLFLKARRNTSLSDLYYNFSNFQKYLDRAITTLPEYVDYEILFTRKEITQGIPVLQEYLQQRAVYEQEQIKKAKESQVVHEQYDFSALGINGSLVMEKAMRECEFYLGNKKRILAEISELEGQRDMLDKSYDEKNKTSQRKLRDIQDSLDRLKEKLDSTTNLIVGNDLRKQRENEIQKQRQIEKESEDDNNKYEIDKKKISDEIDVKKKEIDEFRKNAEISLNAEFKTYADKIYNQLKSTADVQVKDEIDTIKSNNEKLQQDLEDREKCIVEKNTLYDEKLALIEQYSQKIANDEQTVVEAEQIKEQFNSAMGDKATIIKQKDDEIFDVKRELESRNLELQKKQQQIEKQKEYIKQIRFKRKVEVSRYFDKDGREFFYDDNGNAYYVDDGGQVIYKQDMPINETAGFEAEVTGQNDFMSQQIAEAENDFVNNEETPSSVEAEKVKTDNVETDNVETKSQTTENVEVETPKQNETVNQDEVVDDNANLEKEDTVKEILNKEDLSEAKEDGFGEVKDFDFGFTDKDLFTNTIKQDDDVETWKNSNKEMPQESNEQVVEKTEKVDENISTEIPNAENILKDNPIEVEKSDKDITKFENELDDSNVKQNNVESKDIDTEKQDVKEESKNESVDAKQQTETDNQQIPTDANIDSEKQENIDIESEIAEQDKKLKEQTSQLSKQLEKTKDVALDKPKKKTTGKSGKSGGNKSSGGSSKKSTSSKAKKTVAKKDKPAKVQESKTEKEDKPTNVVSLGDFTLSQFSDALNQAINKIDDKDSK